MPIELQFKFSSPKAEEFFFCSKRNICWNSGYGAGKTYAACQKIVALLAKFPGYRVAIGRNSATDLKRTTMQTFFKVCPPELYDERYGGKRVESPIPYLQLVNGSRVYWMHFDECDESNLRSLEVNAALVDQCEEIKESTYLTLDSRVGRWDEVDIPQDLLSTNPNWPRNKFTNRPLAPAYHLLLCNPPDEGEFSWIFQRFHPNSPDFSEYSDTHHYIESGSGENKALPPEILATMMSRDPEWVERFVHGKFSRGEGAIHYVHPASILEVSPEWLMRLIRRSALVRVLDHGTSSVTCCTWWAACDGKYFCYREYYRADDVISAHRKNIIDLSGDEYYARNLADPSIFKKTQEKFGGFWSVADEYADENLEYPPIYWSPADNNELATRNRINELLRLNVATRHPLTEESPAPRVYFIKRTELIPFGCNQVIRQTSSQRKKLLDEVKGRRVYSDERKPSIEDHAYDTLRYYCASHLSMPGAPRVKAPENSFMRVRERMLAVKQLRSMPRIA